MGPNKVVLMLPIQDQATPQKLDFVVVTFAAEFPLLLLQARSLAKLNANEVINRYVVIWNDHHDDEEVYEQFEPLLAAELAGSGIAWTIVTRSKLIDEDLARRHKGRRVQQVLKLMAANLSHTDLFCVLDTKNHFIRPPTLEDFVSSDGLPRAHLQSYANSGFVDFIHGSMRYFGVETSGNLEVLKRALPTTTPYVLNRSVVVSLLHRVQIVSAKPFPEAFLENPELDKTTEFLLYYAYITAAYGGFEDVYSTEHPIYVTFFKSAPVGSQNIANAIQRMQLDHIKVAGLHSYRIPRLVSEEVDAFVDIWCKAGLFGNREDARRFLTDFPALPLPVSGAGRDRPAQHHPDA